MIGVWYATFSIKYLFSDIIDEAVAFYCKEEKAWIIYESIKTGIIGLNLIIFGITCRWYRYHERDEVVNVQGMIEDIFRRNYYNNKMKRAVIVKIPHLHCHKLTTILLIIVKYLCSYYYN